ncbi:MAG: hypothetical protein R3330_09625 [Saprospiraceae bacterium]|nr:hypothetical protein [Saprospiraceae bacterium]
MRALFFIVLSVYSQLMMSQMHSLDKLTATLSASASARHALLENEQFYFERAFTENDCIHLVYSETATGVSAVTVKICPTQRTLLYQYTAAGLGPIIQEELLAKSAKPHASETAQGVVRIDFSYLNYKIALTNYPFTIQGPTGSVEISVDFNGRNDVFCETIRVAGLAANHGFSPITGQAVTRSSGILKNESKLSHWSSTITLDNCVTGIYPEHNYRVFSARCDDDKAILQAKAALDGCIDTLPGWQRGISPDFAAQYIGPNGNEIRLIERATGGYVLAVYPGL